MADETEDTTEILEEALKNPKKVEVDNQTVEQHSLEEQIAMDRYLASRKAAAASPSKGFGIKFAKIMPPSAV